MKNLLIGLFVLGLTNLSSAQNTQVEFLKSQMESNDALALNMNTNAPVFNNEIPATSSEASYLSNVKEEATSNHVQFLEDKVSRFDVTTLSKFDARSASFKVIFKGNKGSITATYDCDGDILTTSEKFEDVKLPISVRNAVYQEYPGWSTLGNSYSVNYNKNIGAKKVYKVKITNGRVKKNLKIDSEGNII